MYKLYTTWCVLGTFFDEFADYPVNVLNICWHTSHNLFEDSVEDCDTRYLLAYVVKFFLNAPIYIYLLGHYLSINITVAISHVAGVFALQFPKLLKWNEDEYGCT